MEPVKDLLIVGGGPAGLATAIRARLAGMEATVLDRFQPPIDKACGEGLMPDAVARLREIGAEPPGSASAVIRGIRYIDGDLCAEGIFPKAGGLGVRRLQLHKTLVRRAEETGVELLWGVKAQGLAGDGIVTDRGTIRARWIVGADGLLSRVRKWVGLEGGPGPLRRFGVRRHYLLTPWTDSVEVHWGPACEAYVTPVGPDEIGVALLWNEGPEAGGFKTGFDGLLARLPALRERLEGAPVGSRDRGAGPLHQKVLAVHRGNLALVGDASGYLDAITGEGMAVALHESAALVDALLAGDLNLYAAAHRRISRLPDFMTSMVLALERRPRLRRRALRALAADPALFSRLLGIHGRTLPLRGFGFDGALRLAWRLVAA